MKQEVSLLRAHRLLAGRPVVLLTTELKGQINVMSLAWHCPVSLEPPLIMLAIHPGTLTHELLRGREECVLNIPARPLLETVMDCGFKSGRDHDKIADNHLTLESGQNQSTPWIDECIAHIECVMVERYEPGDHTLFVMQVLGAWAEEQAFAQCWSAPFEVDELTPLVHLGGSMYVLPGQVAISGSQAG